MVVRIVGLAFGVGGRPVLVGVVVVQCCVVVVVVAVVLCSPRSKIESVVIAHSLCQGPEGRR